MGDLDGKGSVLDSHPDSEGNIAGASGPARQVKGLTSALRLFRELWLVDRR